ncbi:MAG: 23S rRNA (adenine(2503)-C(2))-methyltransferase RlmN [Gammaproteobacteria bacterium]|nr:23S rRNA (adenine(2503)-C(2))-methyltransferase RlmN [Gammaproteobacteria bacterium]NNC96868.1 23S rRNA (adenine(2503)-C(2))-methyltransferase RlmN [Gammaproteobacteria bacterium]NNM13013.1 23S rRNA (adenine(2503)-C(2))-methyltransferase RlmN [Gammaproteobacteria bacterium]
MSIDIPIQVESNPPITENKSQQNLLGMTRTGLEKFFAGLGEKPFRARQIMKWIYKKGAADFSQMTDLSKKLREKLLAEANLTVPEIMTTQHSADGTRKWLLRMDSSQGIETVFIPDGARGTLCVSSQVGCALDCSFCSTAQQGFNRNLSAAEIVGQVWLAQRELALERGIDLLNSTTPERIITNVVFMGMGEPLANYREVVPAMQILRDDIGFDLSRRRVTLSTSGLVPQLNKLAAEVDVALAVSLHAPSNDLRNELVPINRKHPIEELLPACWDYLQKTKGRNVTFEYVMLQEVNDHPEQAHALADLLKNKTYAAKVNLIPFNPFPGTEYQRSSGNRIERFRKILASKGVIATTRRTRGDDIDAACGQLAGKVANRVKKRMGNKRFSNTSEA